MREDWVKVELGKVCEHSKGKKPKVLNPEYSNTTPIPYINIKAFEKHIFEEYTDGIKCNLCEDGDLLMVWDGARAGLTGKAIKGAIGSTLMKIEPIPGIEKNYLFYYLLSLYIKLNTNPRGVGIPHVEPRLLWNSSFLIPDVPTQRAIVAKIEQLLSDLDNGITNLKTAKGKLEIYHQAVLKKAFEGGYVEKKKEYSLPEGWSHVKINTLCEVVRGGSPRPAGDERFYNGNIPFLKVADLTRNNGAYLKTFTYTIKEAGLKKTRYVNSNTLLLSNSGATLGVPKICTFPTTFNDGIAAFLGLSEETLLYHYHFWNSKTKELRGYNQGAAQPNLNTGIIGAMVIPIGPLNDMKKTVQAIESRLSVCDKLSESIDQSLDKSEALRQSILKKAFEGKLLKESELEACRKENDWEPAEKLLERIKKDKVKPSIK